jgi:hypothetical protein
MYLLCSTCKKEIPEGPVVVIMVDEDTPVCKACMDAYLDKHFADHPDLLTHLQ